jgi:hypothetical protein
MDCWTQGCVRQSRTNPDGCNFCFARYCRVCARTNMTLCVVCRENICVECVSNVKENVLRGNCMTNLPFCGRYCYNQYLNDEAADEEEGEWIGSQDSERSEESQDAGSLEEFIDDSEEECFSQ